MPYQKTQWINNNEPSINAQNLNKIEQGIYDNSVAVETQAGLLDGHTVRSDVPSGAVFTDTTYTAGANVQINGTTISATDTIYDDTELRGRVTTVEGLLDGHSVAKNVPADAVFTDTVYDDTELSGRVTQTESDIDDLQEATEHLSDGDTVYPYASEIEIEDALGVNAKDVKVKITAVQSGSGTPSPQNVRPISGWDECKVERVGKNRLGAQARLTPTTYQGVTFTPVYDEADNLMYIDVTGTSARTNVDYYLFGASGVYVSAGIPTGNYIMSDGLSDSQGDAIGIIVIKSNGSIVEQTRFNHTDTPIAFDGSETYRITIRCYDGNTNYNYRIYPMIRIATDTDPTFEPYKGKTYTIQLGDTIYGGELDVTTGVMTVDKAYAEFDGSQDEVIGMSSSSVDTQKRYSIGIGSDSITNTDTMLVTGTLFCDKFLETANYYTYRGTPGICYQTDGTHKIVVTVPPEIDTTTKFRTWLSENILQVVYGLATPFTIQLTPQQIQLLDGYNYLTANTGNIQVTTTDIQGAIGQADVLIEANTQAIREINSFDDSIFGTVENGTTASKAYAQGDYFVKDKKMCKALTSIAQGAIFTLDTNYAAYTIAEILKAIEQS